MVLVHKWPFFSTFLFRQYRPGKFFLPYSRTKKRFSKLWKQKAQKLKKIDIFSKELAHGFGLKMAIFPTVLFRQYRPGKCLLRYSRTKKMPFYAIKTRTSNSPQIDTFPKGLTHGFGPKMAIFPTFLFKQYRPRKCLLRYSRTRERLSKL